MAAQGTEEQDDAGPRGPGAPGGMTGPERAGGPGGGHGGAWPGTSRRLSGREQAFWYGLAGVSYVVASIVQKGLSNWFVGPMWLVAVVWFGPLLADRARAAWRRNPAEEPEEP